MSVEQPNLRGRYICMTPRDIEAMSNAIRAVFPRLVWIRSGRPEYPMTMHTSTRGVGTPIIGLCPDEDWQPVVIEKNGFPTFERWPRNTLHIMAGEWKWLDGVDDPRRNFDLPLPIHGYFSMGIDAKNQDDLEFVKTIYRAIGHCLFKGGKRSEKWVGLDMCRWAQEGAPRRAIGWSRWRPPTDYVFPADNPYYAGTEDIPRGDEWKGSRW